MGWKECLEGQQLKGRPVNTAREAIEARFSINRIQFGRVRIKYRDAAGRVVKDGPLDTDNHSNPLKFTVPAGASQLGWQVEIARANDADPFPDVDVAIVQGNAEKLAHSYVCPDDRIPDSGIDLRDFVDLT